MSKFLTREEILRSQDIPEEVVPVPEWGGDVLVRGLSLGEAHQVIQEMGGEGERDVQKMNLWAITHGIRGEDGQQVFTEEDHDALLQKSSAACLRVTRVFTRISGLGEEAKEETRKNSSEMAEST